MVDGIDVFPAALVLTVWSDGFLNLYIENNGRSCLSSGRGKLEAECRLRGHGAKKAESVAFKQDENGSHWFMVGRVRVGISFKLPPQSPS